MIENAQLIGLSRQMALQRQMDVVANNIANINTTGFKSEKLLFEEYLMPVARDRDFAFADQRLSYTEDWTTIHDMRAGGMAQTGNALDVALNGPGFLVVDTPAGERYTRAGALQIDHNGTLTDMSGNPILGFDGVVRFNPTDTEISFGPDGTVITSNGVKGQLRLVEFDDVQALERAGENMFSGGAAREASATRLEQGMIERSNVSGVSEMAQMIRVQRSYQSLASLMQRQDELRRSAIQRLGDTSA